MNEERADRDYDKGNLSMLICDTFASLLSATFHQGKHDRNHKLCNIVSPEIYILHMHALLKCCYMIKESSQSDY